MSRAVCFSLPNNICALSFFCFTTICCLKHLPADPWLRHVLVMWTTQLLKGLPWFVCPLQVCILDAHYATQCLPPFKLLVFSLGVDSLGVDLVWNCRPLEGLTCLHLLAVLLHAHSPAPLFIMDRTMKMVLYILSPARLEFLLKGDWIEIRHVCNFGCLTKQLRLEVTQAVGKTLFQNIFLQTVAFFGERHSPNCNHPNVQFFFAAVQPDI